MSVKWMAMVWEYEFDYAEQAVMLALADHADPDGCNIWPALEHLAWKTGYSKRHVQRVMSSLRKRGILIPVRAARHHSPTVYRIDLSPARAKEAWRPDQKRWTKDGVVLDADWTDRGDTMSPQDEGGVTSTTSGVTSTTVRGDTHVTLTTKNHHNEPSLVDVCKQLEELGYSSQNATTLARRCVENGLGVEDIYAWWGYIADYNAKKPGRGKIRSPLGFLRSKIELAEKLPARDPPDEYITERAEVRQRRSQLLSEWQMLLKDLTIKLFIPQVYPRLLELKLVGKENGAFLVAHDKRQIDYLTTRLPELWQELQGKCRVVV